MNPKPVFEAVTRAYGRTVFHTVAAHRTCAWRWSMPAGHRFIIHDAPKPEENKNETASTSP